MRRTTKNPVMGEICLLRAICQNTCLTAVLHLYSCCCRSSSISHKSNRPNLNHGVPQWKANIILLATEKYHLLYKMLSSILHCCRPTHACLYISCLQVMVIFPSLKMNYFFLRLHHKHTFK